MQQPNNEDIQKKPTPNIQEKETTTSDATSKKTEHHKTEKIRYFFNGEVTIQKKTTSDISIQTLEDTTKNTEYIEKHAKITETLKVYNESSELNENITVKEIFSKIPFEEFKKLIDIKKNIEIYKIHKKYEQQDDDTFKCIHTYQLMDLSTPKPDESLKKTGFFPGHGVRTKEGGRFFEVDYYAPQEPYAKKLKKEYYEQLKQSTKHNSSAQTAEKMLNELLDKIKFIAEIKSDKAINTLEEFFKYIEMPERKMSQKEYDEVFKKECDEILKKEYNKILKKLTEQNQDTQTTEEKLGAKLQKIGLLASNNSNEALNILETDKEEKLDQIAQATQTKVSESSEKAENITRIRTTCKFEISERAEEEETVKQNLNTKETEVTQDKSSEKQYFADRKNKLTLNFPNIYRPTKQNLNDKKAETSPNPSSINTEHTKDTKNQTTLEDQEIHEAIEIASDEPSEKTTDIESKKSKMISEDYTTPQSSKPRPSTPAPEATETSSDWSPEKRIYSARPTKYIKAPIIGTAEATTDTLSEKTKDDTSQKITLVFERPEFIRNKTKPMPNTTAPEIIADSSSEKKHESCETCAKKPKHQEVKQEPDVEYTTYEYTLSKTFDDKEKAELAAQSLSVKTPEEVINASSEKDALTLDPQEYMDQLLAEIELTTSKPEELKPNTQITEATSSAASEKTIDSMQNISI